MTSSNTKVTGETYTGRPNSQSIFKNSSPTNIHVPEPALNRVIRPRIIDEGWGRGLSSSMVQTTPIMKNYISFKILSRSRGNFHGEDEKNTQKLFGSTKVGPRPPTMFQAMPRRKNSENFEILPICKRNTTLNSYKNTFKIFGAPSR